MASGLKRVLGPVDATCVVVGAIIGVGIFFTPSRVAELAGSGSPAMWTWAIGGGIALLGALTFAELGGLYPRSGGQYDVLRDAWGTLPAFLFVFCNATAVQAGAIAIIAVVCAQHLGIAVGTSPGALATTVIAALLILGLVAANGVGVRWGARIQNLTVLAKVATLMGVTALAAWYGAAPEAGGTGGAAGGAVSVAVGAGIFGAVFAGLVPVLFVAGELCVIAGAALDPGVRGAALIGVAWIAAGTVCYLLFFRDPPAASPAGDTRS